MNKTKIRINTNREAALHGVIPECAAEGLHDWETNFKGKEFEFLLPPIPGDENPKTVFKCDSRFFYRWADGSGALSCEHQLELD